MFVYFEYKISYATYRTHDTIIYILHIFSCTSQDYGVASICRLPEIIGLFCKRALYKRLYSAKETYHFKEPANRSHPIANTYIHRCSCIPQAENIRDEIIMTARVLWSHSRIPRVQCSVSLVHWDPNFISNPDSRNCFIPELIH